jgi:hypothetical protein
LILLVEILVVCGAVRREGNESSRPILTAHDGGDSRR